MIYRNREELKKKEVYPYKCTFISSRGLFPVVGGLLFSCENYVTKHHDIHNK